MSNQTNEKENLTISNSKANSDNLEILNTSNSEINSKNSTAETELSNQEKFNEFIKNLVLKYGNDEFRKNDFNLNSNINSNFSNSNFKFTNSNSNSLNSQNQNKFANLENSNTNLANSNENLENSNANLDLSNLDKNSNSVNSENSDFISFDKIAKIIEQLASYSNDDGFGNFAFNDIKSEIGLQIYGG